MAADDGGSSPTDSPREGKRSDPSEVVGPEDTEAQDDGPAVGPGGQLPAEYLRQLSVHRGPLPTPEDFAGYEDVLEGAADRILAIAEEETRHRRRVVEKQVDSDINSERRGQWLAFALSLAVLGAATYLMANGMAGWGFAMFLLQFLGIASAYVAGQKLVRKETEEDRDAEQLSLRDEAEARHQEEGAAD